MSFAAPRVRRAPPFSRPRVLAATLGVAPPWVDQTDWGTPPRCRPGAEEKDGACEPTFTCPDGFHRNSKTGWCDPDKPVEYCGPDYYYDSTLGDCVAKHCKPPFLWDLTRDICVHEKAGQPCCPNQPLSAPCVSDKVWTEDGQCIGRDLKHCEKIYTNGPKPHYDAKTGLCTCPDGYERREHPPGCYKIEPPQGEAESGKGSNDWLWLVPGVVVGVVGMAWWLRRPPSSAGVSASRPSR